MFREYRRSDYHPPAESENEETHSNSYVSIVSPSRSSSTENWFKFIETDQIVTRIKKRKRLLIMGLSTTGLIVIFGVLFSTLHTNTKALQDVYPELTEKMTAVFPDQEEVELLSPVASTPSTTTTTTPATITSAPMNQVTTTIARIPSQKSIHLTETVPLANISAVSVTATTTAKSKSGGSGKPFPKHPHRKKKILPENAAEQNAVSLLNHMAIDVTYIEYVCKSDPQLFGYALKLLEHDKMFGPIYGYSKKIPKKVVSELAAKYLYDLVYPEATGLRPGDASCEPRPKAS